MDFFSRLRSLGYAIYIYLSDDDGNITRFKHFCSKKDKPKFEELLNPLVGSYPKFAVESTAASCRFVKGVEQERDKIFYFDKS